MGTLMKASTLALLVVTVLVAATTALEPEGKYGMVIVAHKLPEKPDRYFVLTEPDSYVEQAISKPHEEVYVGSWDKTEFDEMVEDYETPNVEFNGKYYEVNCMSKDPPALTLRDVALLSFSLLAVAWVALGIAAVFYWTHTEVRWAARGPRKAMMERTQFNMKIHRIVDIPSYKNWGCKRHS